MKNIVYAALAGASTSQTSLSKNEMQRVTKRRSFEGLHDTRVKMREDFEAGKRSVWGADHLYAKEKD